MIKKFGIVIFLITLVIQACLCDVDRVEWARLSPANKSRLGVTPENDVNKVHVIFMNHLDVGYSDMNILGLASNVINTYFHSYFPRALKLSQDFRNSIFAKHGFRYTTQPWLLDLYLDCPPNMQFVGVKIQCPNETDRQAMIAAIKRGDILWHAGPMNMNYENLNYEGLQFSLNISHKLDLAYRGAVRKGGVLSLRDVPGLTKGVIPLLVKNNIIGISHGINPSSANPATEKVTRWRLSPDDAVNEVLYEHRNGYPNNAGSDPDNPGGLSSDSCSYTPADKTTGLKEVLCFSFRTDNSGPPDNMLQVLQTYWILTARYPKADIVASTMDDFFAVLFARRAGLPLFTQEMGDSWIQGTSSDPRKFAEYRAMARQFSKYLKAHPQPEKEVANASRFMIKPAEHTWGDPSDNDNTHWSNAQFATVRNFSGITDAERSWTEQRQLANMALDALGSHPLKSAILKEFAEIKPPTSNQPNLTGYSPVENLNELACVNNNFVAVIGSDGAIYSLQMPKETVPFSVPSFNSPWGRLVYQTYNETDTSFFLQQYGGQPGYGKPGSTPYAHPESRRWDLTVRKLYKLETTQDKMACQFYTMLEPKNATASSNYGAPKQFWIHYNFQLKQSRTGVLYAQSILYDVYWFFKPPTRLMESIFFSFESRVTNQPLGTSPRWWLSKIGYPVLASDVVTKGSQWQHTVDDDGIFLTLQKSGASAKFARNDSLVHLSSPDIPVVCTITDFYGPTAWPAPLKQIADPIVGWAFNLYNNVWNTNYIRWYPYSRNSWSGAHTDTDDDDTADDSAFKARFSVQLPDYF